ncbi:hypothetical protein BOTBODRAFT_70391 [Botryobasidium botryosum FD-172 SS1]|uniref:MYND-type domain-containing protein n=1 Tax=Botryobasidium botryosum (strain FD-172 SS1) TaxID=930990 RepID=A0A067LWE5_BOTB1|nr:hypothetical protein BOTBODRAFT_70391 [Botryobasidium botryosum FD-172 SS1]
MAQRWQCSHGRAGFAGPDRDIPVAPQTRRRHPESDPAQRQRRGLSQCQSCWKSKADGIVLEKCDGCKMIDYCSPECQRKGWPNHKVKCKINQATVQATRGLEGESNALRSFANKHRPTLAKYSMIALNLVVDRTRCTRDVLLTPFYVIDANVVPLNAEEFGERSAEEMREQLRIADEEQKSAGLWGSLFVVLRCRFPTCTLTNITAVGFGKTALSHMRPGLPWKSELKRMMNEGIVI